MSNGTLGLMIQDAAGNTSALARISGALNMLEKRAAKKSKAEAKRIRSQKATLRYYMRIQTKHTYRDCD